MVGRLIRNLPFGHMGTSKELTAYEGVLGLGLLGLAIFAWLPDSYFRMVSWPWMLVWQGAFLSIMGACVWRLRRFQQPVYCLGFGFDWLTIGLLMCLAISGLGADFPVLALQNLLMVVCYGILLYGLRNTCWSPQQLCQGVVWVGAIAAIISLVLWRPTPDMWLSNNFYEALRNRFPLGHHNFTGGYFVLVMPLAFGLAWMDWGWRRWGYGLLGVVITAALYASGSRGAWLGGIVLLLFTLAYGIVRSRGKARLGAIAFSGLILCLVLVLIGSNPRIRSLLDNFQNPPEAASLTTGILKDGPAIDRVFMVQATSNVLKHRPLGLGPGNLGRLYERYRPFTAGTGLNQVQQVHNTPLQLVVEMGVLGALWYLSLLICLVKLTYHLKKLSSRQDQRLSVAVTMSFVGYGISSLSDYQLENIPIAVTLAILLASLIKLGGMPATFPQTGRRWSSLFILMVVVLVVQLWLRSNLALWITHQGLASIGQGNLIQSDNKFYTATALAPWDPTPIALGAQQLTEIALTAEEENQKVLRQEAIELYQRALQVAPNDIWFNQNLAVLAWQTGDATTAYRAIAKVVQLSPRSKNHSYYLLGLIAEALGDVDIAIEAWALECVINPQTILFTSWYQELEPFREAVFAQTLNHYQTILAQLQSDHPLYASLQTHIRMLHWWTGASSQEGSVNRPLLQALLAIEEKTDQTKTLLEQCITEVPQDASACRLLKAWLQPAALDQYLNTVSLDLAEQNALRSHITDHRTIRTWLRSTTQPVPDSQRVALALLYRNYYAQRISSILLPKNLQQFSLPTSLNLFPLTWPRKFAPVDNLVEQVRAETLGFPHPTRNNFQFTVPRP